MIELFDSRPHPRDLPVRTGRGCRTEVVAVVCTNPAHAELAQTTRAAVDAQLRRPDDIVVVPAHRGVAAASGSGLRDALGRGAEWVWLLDGTTVPEPEALDALLAARAIDGLPAPVLLASNVLDDRGRPHLDSLPSHELFEKEISVAAVERGMVHLRSARHGSLLVSRGAVERFGVPRRELPRGNDVLEWTTGMLRRWEDPGYLVTSSVAVRRVAPGPVDRREDFRSRLRMLRSSAWSPKERLYYGYLLGIDAVGAMAGREPVPRA